MIKAFISYVLNCLHIDTTTRFQLCFILKI